MYDHLKLKTLFNINIFSINNALMVGKFCLLSSWDNQDTNVLLYTNRFIFEMKLICTTRTNKESI